MCRICNSPPGSLGTHGGRLAVYKPFTGSPGVLLITTQGRPTHLTCGQTISRIIIPPAQGHGEKGNCTLFLDRIHRSCVSGTGRRPVKGRQPCCLRDPGASPSSLAWAGTYPHGWYLLFKLQSERFFFPVRPIAQKKRQNITRVKNIFLIFFANGKSAY